MDATNSSILCYKTNSCCICAVNSTVTNITILIYQEQPKALRYLSPKILDSIKFSFNRLVPCCVQSTHTYQMGISYYGNNNSNPIRFTKSSFINIEQSSSTIIQKMNFQLTSPCKLSTTVVSIFQLHLSSEA